MKPKDIIQTEYIVKDNDGVYLWAEGKKYSWVRDPRIATYKYSKYDAKQNARRILGADATFRVVDKKAEVTAYLAQLSA